MTIDKTKPALGYEVVPGDELSSARMWHVHALICAMPDDFGPGLLVAPGTWPEGERFRETEADAIAASHRYREEFVRPDVVDFAERFAAWWGTPACLNAHDRWRLEQGPTADRSLRAFLLYTMVAAARGERSLP